MSESARLGLPMMQPGQAQKEMIHNEALLRIDLIAQACVVAVGLNDPPGDPVAGACWIVGDLPTGAWAGQSRVLAGWTEGGWRFVRPTDGFLAWCSSELRPWRYEDSGWQVPAIAGSHVMIDGDVAGGTVVDTEARATIAALLAALRAHGLIAAV